jgi:hypothetical protein
MNSLLEFVNLAQLGKFEQWFYDFIAGANLVALQKGNHDVRPIAMGNMFRKLVSRCMLIHFRADVEAFFTPTQFGVGARQGAETIVHAMNVVVEQHPDWVLFQTDFRNAYNSVYRSKSLQVVKRRFPAMLPWLRAIYAPKSRLWLEAGDRNGRHTILSEEGAQQGDPLGPFLFCAAMHEVLRRANEVLRVTGGLALGYIYDITGIGPEESVQQCLITIQHVAQEYGLELQLSKCSAYDHLDKLSRFYRQR